MVSLSYKKIADEGGVARILKEARLSARIGLEKIEKVSLVQKKYLVALEEGRYWELPSLVFARQFFKAYCKCLSLSSEMLLDRFENEYRTHLNWQERGEKKPEITRAPRIVINLAPLALRQVFLGLLVVGFFTYIGWQINHIVTPPQLAIDSPSDNLVTSRQVIDIKGKVEAESRLTINGQEVYPDKSGQFTEVIGLQPGINFINFTAKKKYSRENVIVRKIMVSSQAKLSQNQVSKK